VYRIFGIVGTGGCDVHFLLITAMEIVIKKPNDAKHFQIPYEWFSKKRCMDELRKDSSHYNNCALQVRMNHITEIIGPRLVENMAPALSRGEEL
jgi:hypothetical protein